MAAKFGRRGFLKYTVCAGAAANLLGCITPGALANTGSTPLVDAHAHIFNGSDLPIKRFLKIVVFKQYPEQGTELKQFNAYGADIVDWLIELAESIFVGRPPTAEDELKFLQGKMRLKGMASDSVTGEQETIERIASFLPTLSSNDLIRQKRLSPKGAAELREAFLKAAGLRHDEKLSLIEIARRAFYSITRLGHYLRWIHLFTLYRHTLLDTLVDDYRRQGFKPVLITPALVDYSTWLQEPLKESPLANQIAVMGELSKRTSTPLLHGFVGFDPLREVFYRRGINGETTNALGLVRDALKKHGFLGVKLYPPMGFKPLENAVGQTYPRRLLKLLDNRISDDLNEVLNELYTLCDSLDAPILAHAAESNPAGPEYAKRGDPHHWRPVFRRYPKVRITLAHFGRFGYQSEAASLMSKSVPLERTWEWQIGRYLKENPTALVYADMSFLSEVLNSELEERRKSAANLRAFVAEFDPEVRHLTFGSDWVMLGIEHDYPVYTQKVDSFLREDCQFSQEQLHRFFFGNALDALGLRPGSGCRKRLETFYQDSTLPLERLAVLDN